MSRKYPDQTKRDAIGIRQLHADISFTRYTTAVRGRALRRWREQLRKKQNSYMSEKTFQSDIKRTQNQLVAANSAETCQQAACQIDRGYPPHPPQNATIYILYLYTMPKHGYFMGILWAFYGHSMDICSDIRSATDGLCRRAVSKGDVGGRCLRALRARRSVSAGDVYVPYATGGQCRRSVSAGDVYVPYATYATLGDKEI